MILNYGINDKLILVIQSNYFFSSLITTLQISSFSGLLAILLTYGNLEFVRRSKNKREIWFYLLIIFSPAIIAVGYYIFINEFLRLNIPSIIIVIVINTIFILF